MENLSEILSILTNSFKELVLSGNIISEELKNEINKNTLILCSILKKNIELFNNESIIELLSLYSATTATDDPEIFEICKKTVDQILEKFTTNSLLNLWDNTNDIGLCNSISRKTLIDPKSFFPKILKWIENPQIESPFFYHFINIIKNSIYNDIEITYFFSIVPLITDKTPIRSYLTFYLLNNFEEIHPLILDLIVSSWIICKNKTPLISNLCRKLLNKSSNNKLNLYSTLCFDFPNILCILPKKTNSFTLISKISIHRIKLFYKNYLEDFLILCDPLVRYLHKEECNNLLNSFLIYDSTFDLNKNILKYFNNNFNNDILSSLLYFGKYTSRDSIELNKEISEKIIYNINNIEDNEINLNEININNNLILEFFNNLKNYNILNLKNLINYF